MNPLLTQQLLPPSDTVIVLQWGGGGGYAYKVEPLDTVIVPLLMK